MSTRQARRFVTVLAATLLAATADAADDPGAFVRLAAGPGGEPAALEVAIASFAGADGVAVDLVGVVHVADAAYFERIDARLAGYEAVLYELVGDPESELAPPPDPALSFLARLQGGMTELLGLSHQLAAIDYSRPNMVHADLTREAFRESMEARGESFTQLLLRAWAFSLTDEGQEAAARQNLDLLRVLFAENRRLALKRMLAGQLADEEMLREILSGGEGSTLIEVRNAHAIETLRRQLAAGRKDLAIFYGAAHLSDLAERLERELDLEPTGLEWFPAWSLREAAGG